MFAIFYRIPLFVKLLLAPIVTIVLMLVLASFGLISLSKLINSVEFMSIDLKNQAQQAGYISKYSRQKQFIVEKYISNYSEKLAAEFTITNNLLVDQINLMKSGAPNPETLAILDQIESENTAYTRLFRLTVIDIKKSDGYFDFTEDLANKLRSYAENLALNADGLSDSSWEQLAKEGNSVLKLADILYKSSLTIAIFALVIGTVLTWVFITIIRKQIKVLSTALYDIAHGDADLTQRLDETGRDDLSYLAHQFNNFMDSLQSIISELKNSMADFEQAASMSEMVSSSTAQKIEKQSQQTESVASAIIELGASSQQVASISLDTETASQSASEHATTGYSVVHQSMSSMESLAREVNQAVTVIGSLETGSEQIGSVSDVIKSIAEQTNLLALNAAIEAARAGEQGRGFAVVADEVRTLATRTHESTSEIQTIIEQLQSDTKAAVQVMERGSKIATDGVSQSIEAESALEEISNANRSVSEMSEQIKTSTQEQSVVVSDVQNSILSIQQLAEDTVSSSKMAQESASNIKVITDNVNSLINRFKVNENEHSSKNVSEDKVVETLDAMDDDGFF